MKKKEGGGVLDSWLDVRKSGGVIQMRTLCNRAVGGGGGVKFGENAYVINGRPLYCDI